MVTSPAGIRLVCSGDILRIKVPSKRDRIRPITSPTRKTTIATHVPIHGQKLVVMPLTSMFGERTKTIGGRLKRLMMTFQVRITTLFSIFGSDVPKRSICLFRPDTTKMCFNK